MKYPLDSAKSLLHELKRTGLSAPQWMLERESFISGKTVPEIESSIEDRIKATRESLNQGLISRRKSFSGMSGADAAKLYDALSKPGSIQDLPVGALFEKCVLYALAINEVNACGGKIVAFPTAGSCGIIPGVLHACHDSVVLPPVRFRESFIVASLIGALIAAKIPLAGAAGGCQAECGAAGSMAAAGLVWCFHRDIEICIQASALALKNSLGLTCDPVAGLVEVPCVKRNSFLASHALTAAFLAMSGIQSQIPFDEVVLAMRQTASMIAPEFRESSLAGLAVTPTGKAIREKLR